jgi:hypothetical protein
MTWRLEVVGDWEYKRMQKQQWDFQANASGGTCSSQQLAIRESEKLRTYHWKGSLSFLTARKPVFALLLNQE